MTGIVKGRVVGPEDRIQQFVLYLRFWCEQKSTAIKGSAFVADEVEIVDSLRIVELDAGDFSGDVAHVVASKRAIDTAEKGRVLLLEPEQKAIRFHAAGRQDEIAGL